MSLRALLGTTLLTILLGVGCTCPVDEGDGKTGSTYAEDTTSRWKSLSFSAFYVCGIQIDGSAHCYWDWYGSEGADYGQADSPDGTFTMVSVGYSHACAVRTDSTVECWGSDDDGESTPPAMDGFVSVSAGDLHSCGLLTDGSVLCWGANGDGESTPPEGGRFLSVAALEGSTCGLTLGHELLCWGYEPYFIDLGGSLQSINSFEQLLVAVNADGTPLSDSYGAWSWPEDSPPVETITAGTAGICGIQRDGSATCANRYDYMEVIAPESVKFSLVEAGHDCACGILQSDQTVLCWGANFFDYESKDTSSWRLPQAD